MGERQFGKGEVIFHKGDYGDSFFRIVAGSVDIRDEGHRLTVLGPGAFFGEMAVLEAYPRSASAVALEDGTRLEEVRESEAQSYFTEKPEMIVLFFRHLSDRLRTLTRDYEAASAALETATGQDKAQGEKILSRLNRALGGLFGNHPKDRISEEAQRYLSSVDFSKGASLFMKEYSAGTVIFREGETSRCMYAIHRGRVGIFTGLGTPEEKKLAELTANQFFGEMGIIEGMPRSAAAVVLDKKTTLEIIGADSLAGLFLRNPAKVNMILKNLSFRLRTLTQQYTDVCRKLRGKG